MAYLKFEVVAYVLQISLVPSKHPKFNFSNLCPIGNSFVKCTEDNLTEYYTFILKVSALMATTFKCTKQFIAMMKSLCRH